MLLGALESSSPSYAWGGGREAAGGVMSDSTEAQDPSARFAGTSPRLRAGRN